MAPKAPTCARHRREDPVPPQADRAVRREGRTKTNIRKAAVAVALVATIASAGCSNPAPAPDPAAVQSALSALSALSAAVPQQPTAWTTAAVPATDGKPTIGDSQNYTYRLAGTQPGNAVVTLKSAVWTNDAQKRYYPTPTHGQWLMADVQIEKPGNDGSVEYNSLDWKLQDTSGVIYNTDTMVGDLATGYLDTPGSSVSGNVGFDVPTGVGYTLLLTDFMGHTEVSWEIPA